MSGYRWWIRVGAPPDPGDREPATPGDRTALPLPRFTPRGCGDGSHYARAHLAADGTKYWRCVTCLAIKPFGGSAWMGEP